MRYLSINSRLFIEKVVSGYRGFVYIAQKTLEGLPGKMKYWREVAIL